MKNARRDRGDSRRPALLMLAGLGVLASLALVLSACGSSNSNSSNSNSNSNSSNSNSSGETTTSAGNQEAQEAKLGAQVFASAGCGSCHAFKAAGSKGTVGPDLNEYLEPDDNKPGIEEMILDPNSEIAEGYSADVMPQNFAETLSPEETKQLVTFLYVNSPAHEMPEGERAEKEKKEG